MGVGVSYYAGSPGRNAPGHESSKLRVIRGGSWTAEARALRAANRFWQFPYRNDTDSFQCAQESGTLSEGRPTDPCG